MGISSTNRDTRRFKEDVRCSLVHTCKSPRAPLCVCWSFWLLCFWVGGKDSETVSRGLLSNNMYRYLDSLVKLKYTSILYRPFYVHSRRIALRDWKSRVEHMKCAR